MLLENHKLDAGISIWVADKGPNDTGPNQFNAFFFFVVTFEQVPPAIMRV